MNQKEIRERLTKGLGEAMEGDADTAGAMFNSLVSLTKHIKATTVADAELLESVVEVAGALQRREDMRNVLRLAMACRRKCEAEDEPTRIVCAMRLAHIEAACGDEQAAIDLAIEIEQLPATEAMAAAVVQAYFLHANLVSQNDDSREAARLLTLASATAEKFEAPDDICISIAVALGSSLREIDQLDAAADTLSRAHQRATNKSEPDSKQVGACLYEQALVELQRGREGSALAILEQCCRLLAEHAEGSEIYPAAEAEWARLIAQSGELGEAIVHMERAVQALEARGGASDPQLGAFLTVLGEMYIRSGGARVSEAAPLLQRALVIAENLFGPEHPTLASVLMLQGQVSLRQDRVADALPTLRRACNILQTFEPTDHLTLAECHNYLGLACLDAASGSEPIESIEQFEQGLMLLTQYNAATLDSEADEAAEQDEGAEQSPSQILRREIGANMALAKGALT